MKNCLLIVIALSVLISCSQDPGVNSLADGEFQYKVNGSLVKISNVSISSGEYVIFFKQIAGSLITQTRYMLNAQKGTNNIWAFGIPTDSLRIQTYSLDTTSINTLGIICTMTYNGQQSALFYGGDFLTINITSYSNSLISGTFSAKFTPFSSLGMPPNYLNRGTTIITEGEFKNIKCLF